MKVAPKCVTCRFRAKSLRTNYNSKNDTYETFFDNKCGVLRYGPQGFMKEKIIELTDDCDINAWEPK